MKLLCICDPSLYTKPTQDVPTTYQRFAQHPNIELFHAPVSAIGPPDRISATRVTGPLSYTGFLGLDQQPRTDYAPSAFDLVFCRRLKPFPDGYLTLLSHWSQQTRFINRPQGKLIQMQPSFLKRVAGDFIPDTLVTDQVDAAQDFWQQHQVIVAKQANSTGGRGVFKLWSAQQQIWIDNSVSGTHSFSTFAAAFAFIQGQSPEALQLVRYLPTVTAGDKRVVVVNGDIYGAYVRRSKSGYWVNNVSVDGECVLAPITDHERQAIEHTVPYFQELGLHTLGYDFLQNEAGLWQISEINAGNIGGFARLEHLTGDPVVERLITWMLDYARPTYPPVQLEV